VCCCCCLRCCCCACSWCCRSVPASCHCAMQWPQANQVFTW
jgi:hypothetical protein